MVFEEAVAISRVESDNNRQFEARKTRSAGNIGRGVFSLSPLFIVDGLSIMKERNMVDLY